MAALSMAGLLASLSPTAAAVEPLDTPEIRTAVENATTQSDHEAVAKYYEEAAAGLQAEIVDKEALLEHYENKAYLYGRRAQDLQSHTHALIREHGKTVKAARQAAAVHRRLAAKLNEDHAASGTHVPATVGGL